MSEGTFQAVTSSPEKRYTPPEVVDTQLQGDTASIAPSCAVCLPRLVILEAEPIADDDGGAHLEEGIG